MSSWRRSDNLTSEQERRLRELWLDERYSAAEIARMIGSKQWTINDAARRLGLGFKKQTHRKDVPDPTPEEIEAACLEIQQLHWTEEDFERRASSAAPRWVVPMCDFEGSTR